MKDIDQIRRDNMVLLEAEAGGPTSAASRLGWDQPQWSNLRSGAADSKTGKPRGMRKMTARKIEAAFSRPEFWLDVDHSGEATTQTNKHPGNTTHGLIKLSAHPDLCPIKPEHQRLIDAYEVADKKTREVMMWVANQCLKQQIKPSLTETADFAPAPRAINPDIPALKDK